MDDHPDVAEAIKRLPMDEQDLRVFRLKRAYDLTMKQIILPEDQWTKPEEVPEKLYWLWFSFIHGSIFLFLCFIFIVIHFYHIQKQRKIKIGSIQG